VAALTHIRPINPALTIFEMIHRTAFSQSRLKLRLYRATLAGLKRGNVLPEAHDTLAIFAEVAVALAGFSGIVIAFGRRSLGSLSRLEIRRLSNLFILSGAALLISLLSLALLHLPVLEAPTQWRWSSATLFVVFTPWLTWDILQITRLEAAERAQINTPLIVIADALAIATLFLQLVNAIYLLQAWPFLFGLVVIIAGAFQQFVLLVRMAIRGEPD
jgi:hypothetical protein